jgi:hypothetical protein
MQSTAIPKVPAIYFSSNGHWVVNDLENNLHIVPGHYNGWNNRRPYKGHQSLLALEQVGAHNALFLGIPFEKQLKR